MKREGEGVGDERMIEDRWLVEKEEAEEDEKGERGRI